MSSTSTKSNLNRNINFFEKNLKYFMFDLQPLYLEDNLRVSTIEKIYDIQLLYITSYFDLLTKLSMEYLKLSEDDPFIQQLVSFEYYGDDSYFGQEIDGQEILNEEIIKMNKVSSKFIEMMYDAINTNPENFENLYYFEGYWLPEMKDLLKKNNYLAKYRSTMEGGVKTRSGKKYNTNKLNNTQNPTTKQQRTLKNNEECENNKILLQKLEKKVDEMLKVIKQKKMKKF